MSNVTLRDRLVLALDVEDLDEAVDLATDLSEYFGVVKIGLELYSASGPTALSRLAELGFAVFVDVKLHDIPTTVRRASNVLGRLGASFVTVHTAGGLEMVRACVEGLSAGASESGLSKPAALGVTVLTSDPNASEATLRERAILARDAGCAGLVCAASDLEVVTSAAPGILTIVPGTRPAGTSHDDQARVTTPQEAMRLGASLLVIGRAVTAARDPRVAARELFTGLS